MAGEKFPIAFSVRLNGEVIGRHSVRNYAEAEKVIGVLKRVYGDSIEIIDREAPPSPEYHVYLNGEKVSGEYKSPAPSSMC